MKRNQHDHYHTPAATVAEFLAKFQQLEPGFDFTTATVLDPASGGCSQQVQPYPEALRGLGCSNVTTVDIRSDSRAEIKTDYMQWYPDAPFDMVITNPPYNLALDFIITALEDCVAGGFVVMLLRLNFLGSQQRRGFWQANTPKYVIVHAARPRFNGTADSCEYAHFIWQKGYQPAAANMYVV